MPDETHVVAKKNCMRVKVLRMMNFAAIVYALIQSCRSKIACRFYTLLLNFVKARFFYFVRAAQWLLSNK